jgi:hypothetical protein
MSVARILAETNVGDDEQTWDGFLDPSDGSLDDPVVVIRFRADIILGRREPEQQDRRDAVSGDRASLFHEDIDRKVVDPRHSTDLIASPGSMTNEKRVDEVAGIDCRFSHEAPKGLAATKAP